MSKRKYSHCKNCSKTIDVTKGNRNFCSACEKTREPSPREIVAQTMRGLSASEERGKSPIRGLNMHNSGIDKMRQMQQAQSSEQTQPSHVEPKEEKKEPEPTS